MKKIPIPIQNEEILLDIDNWWLSKMDRTYFLTHACKSNADFRYGHGPRQWEIYNYSCICGKEPGQTIIDKALTIISLLSM